MTGNTLRLAREQVSVFMRVKQEVTAEGAGQVQYSGEGSLCWLGLTLTKPAFIWSKMQLKQ